MYWFNRGSNCWRVLYPGWRSEKRFFESFRFFSEGLIDQQSDFSHTKHFLERRAWNIYHFCLENSLDDWRMIHFDDIVCQ
jgi:hypothetical protein